MHRPEALSIPLSLADPTVGPFCCFTPGMGRVGKVISELWPPALRTICDVLLSPLSLFTHVAPTLNIEVLAGIKGVWAGTKLIFFPGASMGLCLRFVLETVWITLGWFRSC